MAFITHTNQNPSSSADEFLAHYGKKGMKWGVRKRSSDRPGGERARVKYTKPGHKLSEEQLQKRIKRLEMEKKYNDLRNPNKRGKKFVDTVLVGSGNDTAKKLLSNAALLAVRAGLEKGGTDKTTAELLTGMKRGEEKKSS
jgi:hypothetical protein